MLCTVLAGPASGVLEQSIRSDSDLARLAAFSAATARQPGREECPSAFSIHSNRNAILQNNLAGLIEKGAARAVGMLVIDESIITNYFGTARPANPRLIPRLHQDLDSGRFVAGQEMDALNDGLSSSAWFFYNQFMAAYAGLHRGFRQADSPLARGTAALAALGNSGRGNLALLPDFRPEAALAALVFNADPELSVALQNMPPDDQKLHARIAAAMTKAGLAGTPDKTALVLGMPVMELSSGPFSLRRLLPGTFNARDALWRFALNNIANPGLLGEIGAAIWLGRDIDSRTTAELDQVTDTRILSDLERDIKARGVVSTGAIANAVFDISTIPAVFGFIWTYHPEFAAWRNAVRQASKLTDEAQLETEARNLRRRLADLLDSSSADAVTPAVRLGAIAGVKPEIDFQFRVRPGAGDDEDKPGFSGRLTITWQFVRPLPWGVESELGVFEAAAGELLPDQKSGDPGMIKAAFVRPGLETGRPRPGEEFFLLSQNEQSRLKKAGRLIEQAWMHSRWAAKQVRDPARFQRLMTLYFPLADSAPADPTDFVAACLQTSRRSRTPAWLMDEYQSYKEARAKVLESGNPAGMFAWASHSMLLTALAYETENNELGDAVLREFITFCMLIAVERIQEQPERPAFFHNPHWFMPEAWHWMRDVTSIVRDGKDGRQAWVKADAWNDLLQKVLPEISGSGTPADFYNADSGLVELSGLWMQLYKLYYGWNELDARAVMAAVERGTGEYRLCWLLIAPTQNPAEAYLLASFGAQGSYAGQSSLRSLLGIRVR